MRDWWFEVCETKYGSADQATSQQLDELLAEIRAQGTREDHRQHAIEQIRGVLDEMRRATPQRGDTPAVVTAKVNQVVSATKLGEGVYANVKCLRCNTMIGLLVGSDSCPNCGAPLT